MIAEPVRIVYAWHDALNAGNIERVVALCDDDVEVGGPRGSGRGTLLLRQGFDRAGIRIEPRQVFYRDETIVVEQDASWDGSGTESVTGRQRVASVFIVDRGRIVSIVRYSDLASALHAGGLNEGDHTSARQS